MIFRMLEEMTYYQLIYCEDTAKRYGVIGWTVCSITEEHQRVFVYACEYGYTMLTMSLDGIVLRIECL